MMKKLSSEDHDYIQSEQVDSESVTPASKP